MLVSFSTCHWSVSAGFSDSHWLVLAAYSYYHWSVSAGFPDVTLVSDGSVLGLPLVSVCWFLLQLFSPTLYRLHGFSADLPLTLTALDDFSAGHSSGPCWLPKPCFQWYVLAPQIHVPLVCAGSSNPRSTGLCCFLNPRFTHLCNWSVLIL